MVPTGTLSQIDLGDRAASLVLAQVTTGVSKQSFNRVGGAGRQIDE